MKEFRVHVLDTPGQLAIVSAALSQKLVNIRTIAAVSAAGPVITFITDHEQQAREALDGLALTYDEVDVLTAVLSDQPGELARISKKLADAGINITSVYVLSSHQDETEIAMTVSDLKRARQVLGVVG